MYEGLALNRPHTHGRASRRATRFILCLAGAVLLAAIILPTIARADDQDTIDYRQHIMKTMGQQMILINQIIQRKAPADDLATFTQILALNATTAKSAFMPDVAGGRAKPDVWKNWADFSKRLDELVASTSDLAKAAKAGGVTAAAPKVLALGCMGCHDMYRQKQQK
ncbi:MAG: c-type cytochrome [Steroidobacteraceae bacterium]